MFGLLILAIFYVIMVPLFGVAAFGLLRRRSWAWAGALIALGLSVLLSLVMLTTGVGEIVWLLISAFGVYLFWTDAGIRQELSH